MDDNAREQLGRRVRRRRVNLGLSIDEAAELGTMSPTTWSRVEAGKTVRNLTYGGVDRVLQWGAGTAEAFLTGDEPPFEDHQLEDGGHASDDLAATRDDDAELDELIEQAKVQRDAGDSTLYDTLMAVKRMNEARRQVHDSDARVDRKNQQPG